MLLCWAQFEASLAALKQLEGQYSALAAESAAVEAAGSGRIQQLELELDAARAAQREQDGAVSAAVPAECVIGPAPAGPCWPCRSRCCVHGENCRSL